jgi:hypothetical protein
MMAVDGLLILQAANCNAQIPAKLYEYVRAARPILALTDPQGDTSQTLRKLGIGVIARLDSEAEIAQALLSFIEQLASGEAQCASAATIAAYSRQTQTGQLAALLDDLVAR